MESCGTDLVAEEIYNILLSKYYHIYTSRLGCDGVAAMSLQEIIPYEKCKEPVHTLVKYKRISWLMLLDYESGLPVGFCFDSIFKS